MKVKHWIILASALLAGPNLVGAADAQELVGKANGLVEEANIARDGGDRDTFRSKSKEAQTLFAKALEDTEEFEERIGKENGFDHPDVRRIIKRRTDWRRTLVALKKNTGI